MKVYEKAGHRASTLALYRALLRRINSATKNGVVPPALGDERAKYQLDPSRYWRYIKHEAQYSVRREFEANYERPHQFAQAYYRGIELVHNLTPTNVIESLVKYRQHQYQKQQWRASTIRNKDHIQVEQDKSVAVVEKRRRQWKAKRAQQAHDRSLEYAALPNHKQKQIIKAEYRQSQEYAGHLLRRYLKLQQKYARLPNPVLLPQTPDTNHNVGAYNARYGLPGSTTLQAIDAGYDTEYIEAVVKPSLEYDINKYHFLEPLRHVVTQRGPYQVKIAQSAAGAIHFPYIKVPVPRIKAMKEVAMDTKRSWRWMRIRNVWESKPGEVKVEKSYSDGSYSIIGSYGFGPEQFMFPRSYYQNLADGEAMWEYLVGPPGQSIDSYAKEWSKSLNVTSQVLEAQVNRYYAKYTKLRQPGSSLYRARNRLQRAMNAKFDRQVTRYKALVSRLESHQVFKHSELVSSDRVDSGFSPSEIGSHVGLPEHERIGMGFTLSDHLRATGCGYFRWGNRFYKRFKFIPKSDESSM